MTIRNTIAVWEWMICSAFLCGCAVMSWLLLNNRVPDENSLKLMLAFNLTLWAAGMFAALRVFAKPVTVLRCHAEGITVDSYWPWKKARAYHPKDCILETRIQETKDSEGDPYFTVAVVLINGTSILLAEGHFQELCEQAVNELNKTLHKA